MEGDVLGRDKGTSGRGKIGERRVPVEWTSSGALTTIPGIWPSIHISYTSRIPTDSD